MLRIRELQLAALKMSASSRLADSLVKHVAECFPLHAQTLGAARTRVLVEAIVARAAELQLTTEHDVCELVNLTLVLGDQFERDPRFEWATAVLRDTSVAGTARMRELRRRTIEYLSGAKL
jgi:hypothetical protein